jgi:hypothetical protein
MVSACEWGTADRKESFLGNCGEAKNKSFGIGRNPIAGLRSDRGLRFISA